MRALQEETERREREARESAEHARILKEVSNRYSKIQMKPFHLNASVLILI